MQFPDKTGGAAEPTPEKRVPVPIVPVGAIKIKRPASRRFKEFVFAESPKNIAGNVAKNVVVPRLKEGVQQALFAMINGMLFGNAGSNMGQQFMQGTILRGGGMNYNAISSSPSPLQQAQAANQSRPKVKYQDVRFTSQQHAENVLANMFRLCETFGRVAIGDLNDMIALSSEISDNSYGWTSLQGATISQDGGGWLLELPPSTLL